MATTFVPKADSFQLGNLIQYVDLIQAVAEGKTIQFNCSIVPYVPYWSDIGEVNFNEAPERYRVKKEPEIHFFDAKLFARPSELSATGWVFRTIDESGDNQDIPSGGKIYYVELKLTEIIKG